MDQSIKEMLDLQGDKRDTSRFSCLYQPCFHSPTSGARNRIRSTIHFKSQSRFILRLGQKEILFEESEKSIISMDIFNDLT